MRFESLVREAYLAGTRDQGLLLIKNRLENRVTYCEYDKAIMGPIKDKLGVEQGGQNSDRFYRLVGNFQLNSAQLSNLGVNLCEGSNTCDIPNTPSDVPNNTACDGINISAIGQADDSCLISTSIHSLQNLVNLTLEFCKRYHIELVPEKTKLMAFYPASQSINVYYQKLISNIHINNTKIQFTDDAEHVGIIRNISGNLPHLLGRFSAHSRAVRAVLPAGLARGHSGNPAAGLRIEKIYGAPVLLSGLSSLVLSSSEIESLNVHYKASLEGLMRLHQKTPAPVVFFLAGSLPAPALLHINMFSLLNMIIRLENNPLNMLARHCLSASPLPRHSWFTHIQNLCIKYSLPSALSLLSFPPSKIQLKTLVKKKVIDFWEQKLRHDAAGLSSLAFFKPSFYSLSTPHPIWNTAGSSPYEAKKAKIQARMLSGRYRTGRLMRYWSDNTNGFCLLPSCHQEIDDLPHILLHCPSLQEARDRVMHLWQDHLLAKQEILHICRTYLAASDNEKVQFLLDPSVLPEIIALTQDHGYEVLKTVFYITRTYCFSIHKSRLKLLGIS